MNIGQLEHVVEAIRFSSFALAAKARHTSPQALSKAVSDLERELGVKLFERTGRSVEATPFAREFEKKARHVLLEFEQLRRFPATFLQSLPRTAVFAWRYRIRRFEDLSSQSKISPHYAMNLALMSIFIGRRAIHAFPQFAKI